MKPISLHKIIKQNQEKSIFFCHTDVGEQNESQSLIFFVESLKKDQIHQIAAIIVYRTFLQEYYSVDNIYTGKARLDQALEAVNTALHRFYTINNIDITIDLNLCAVVNDHKQVAVFSNNGFLAGTVNKQKFRRLKGTQPKTPIIFGKTIDETFDSAVTLIKENDMILFCSDHSFEANLTPQTIANTNSVENFVEGIHHQMEQQQHDHYALIAAKINTVDSKIAPPTFYFQPEVTGFKPILPSFNLPDASKLIPEGFSKTMQQWGSMIAGVVLILWIAAVAIRTSAFRPDDTNMPPSTTTPPQEHVLQPPPPSTSTPQPAMMITHSPGDLLWSYKAPKSISSSPAVIEEQVFFGCKDNYLYAIDKRSGAIKWKCQTGGGIGSSPAVSGNRVYVGSYDGHLYCVDAENGSIVWRFRTGEKIVSSPIIYDGVVYIGSFDNHLYAVSQKEGARIWKFKTGGDIWATPTIDDDHVYVASFDGFVYALNREDGMLEWKYRAGDEIYSSPTVMGQIVLFGSRDQYLYALSKIDGKVLWTFKTGGKIYSSPTFWNGTIFVGSNAGILYALDAVSGMEQWQYKIGRKVPIRSCPIAAEGVVYFTAYDHYLYAIDAYSGNKIWKYQASDEIYSSPTISDGIVYFGSLDGKFHAVVASSQ